MNNIQSLPANVAYQPPQNYPAYIPPNRQINQQSAGPASSYSYQYTSNQVNPPVYTGYAIPSNYPPQNVQYTITQATLSHQSSERGIQKLNIELTLAKID